MPRYATALKFPPYLMLGVEGFMPDVEASVRRRGMMRGKANIFISRVVKDNPWVIRGCQSDFEITFRSIVRMIASWNSTIQYKMTILKEKRQYKLLAPYPFYEHKM